MYQSVFFRYEMKYLLTRAQKETVLSAISPYMQADEYGRTTIRNLYFDNEHYFLIRRSLEKPVFKEKLRLRSYLSPTESDPVFAELKRKFEGVVYKRRLSLSQSEGIRWLSTGETPPEESQIAREISRFLSHYGPLSPTVFLAYEREAYRMRDGGDFRVTFDEDIRARREALTLSGEAYGTPLLEGEHVLMEIKCSGGIPLWMSEILSRERLYKTSFSKYGAAYLKLVLPSILTLKGKKENDA